MWDGAGPGWGIDLSPRRPTRVASHCVQMRPVSTPVSVPRSVTALFPFRVRPVPFRPVLSRPCSVPFRLVCCEWQRRPNHGAA